MVKGRPTACVMVALGYLARISFSIRLRLFINHPSRTLLAYPLPSQSLPTANKANGPVAFLFFSVPAASVVETPKNSPPTSSLMRVALQRVHQRPRLWPVRRLLPNKHVFQPQCFNNNSKQPTL
jgi:hypothetical protein